MSGHDAHELSDRAVFFAQLTLTNSRSRVTIEAAIGRVKERARRADGYMLGQADTVTNRW